MKNKKGILLAASSYILWGLLPLYWKLLKEVSAFEVLCQRTIWSLFFLTIIVFLKDNFKTIFEKVRNKKNFAKVFLASIFLSLNWLTYIWAVNNGYVLESSLGYFITPILNILLGFTFLKERLSVLKWISVLLAFTAILNLSFNYGEFPYIATLISSTFAIYGYLKKTSPLNSLEGLFIETLILTPFAVVAYSYFYISYNTHFNISDLHSFLLMILSGPVTAIPLLLFAKGARSINLSTLGILQYISPSIQFLLAVFIFKEDFSNAQLISFIIVWFSIFLFSIPK